MEGLSRMLEVVGRPLWSNSYDRELKDVFLVQDEIAGAVVGALRLKLVLPQRLANTDLTPNPEAYQAYLVGRQFYYAYYTGARCDSSTLYSVTRAANVSLADLDLSTPAGLRAARERLQAMAQRLCSELAHNG